MAFSRGEAHSSKTFTGTPTRQGYDSKWCNELSHQIDLARTRSSSNATKDAVNVDQVHWTRIIPLPATMVGSISREYKTLKQIWGSIAINVKCATIPGTSLRKIKIVIPSKYRPATMAATIRGSFAHRHCTCIQTVRPPRACGVRPHHRPPRPRHHPLSPQ
jgi:hypothetical protein